MSKKTSIHTTPKAPDSRGRTRRGKASAKPSAPPSAEAELIGAQAAAPPGPRGKIGAIVALLQKPQGATVPDLMEATGWQAHSVRGAIAGAIKKKLGLSVTSTKAEAGRVYRIEAVGDAR